MTQHVADVLAAADEERLRVAAAYGVAVQSLQDWIGTAYGHRADSIKAAVGGNPAYVGIKAPGTLQHRYLFEDIPTGLIPLIDLGEAAGLALPTLRYLVSLARTRLGRELWQHPRTLESLGLTGLNADEIRSHVIVGSHRQRRFETVAASVPRCAGGPEVPRSAVLIGSSFI